MSKELSGATKYYLMRRCMNCFFVCEFQLTRCPQCGYLFIGEANEQEKDLLNKKLTELQEKKKGE